MSMWKVTNIADPTSIHYVDCSNPVDSGYPADQWTSEDYSTQWSSTLISRRKEERVEALKTYCYDYISQFAPVWKQINDLDNPSDPDAVARRNRINSIRAQSDLIEQEIMECTTLNDVLSVSFVLEP